MSKTCPNCGVNSPDNAKFCIECAYSLEDVPVNKEEKTSQKDTSSDSGRAFGGIVLIAVIAIAVVAVGFFIFSGMSNNVQPNITITFDQVYASDYESNGKNHYSYYVKGYISNYPDNDADYMIKTIYYDSNGSQITSTVKKLSEFKNDQKSNYASSFGSYYTDNYVDIDHVSVQILKDNAVLNEFNSTMNKNKLTSIPHSNSTSK
ncbi:zinc ribbon domain-containing protein [uncultured Methanobrevibacter sp.]|uniref:zinc ribbon domain-containing protein n=1 Tax=uncultured Methanobrevibacter sp. TaxID=253161 RepID=UPI0026008A01|nr:zinc ribbon domain-containing protein [uncultured Methanobrevibacter sp.]